MKKITARPRQIFEAGIAVPIQVLQGAMRTGNILGFVMPTKLLVSLTLLLTVFACAVPQANDAAPPPSAGVQPLLEFKLSSGNHYAVPAERDATVLKNTKPRKIKIVGEVKDVAVVLIDTYPSIPGGMSYCQAGEERFLRVVSLVKKTPVETFHTKLESCRDNIELASPGLAWSAESTTLVIHWLQGPTSPGKPETRTLVIDAEGKTQ